MLQLKSSGRSTESWGDKTQIVCEPGACRAFGGKKMEMASLRNNTADFLIFSKENGGDGIEVRIEDETIWLTQKLMAELFDTTKPLLSKTKSDMEAVFLAKEN